MSISTHVLDTSLGRPAPGVGVYLQFQDGAVWADVSRGETNADGRVPALIPPAAVAVPGVYRITFSVAAYFKRRGVESFYRDIAIQFEVRNADEHYHVPLLVSPFGYSTYRGS